MRIAVTYENDQVFQHFGHTENFKIYELVEGQIIGTEIVSAEGQGHGALAALLDDYAIDVLICGGLGQGAADALAGAGIEVCAGAQGDCDAAVAAYLRGELESTGVNCDHHHDHEEGHDCNCGDSCGGGCGGGCGGCGGGCGGGPSLLLDGPNAGKMIRVHYTGTLNDGTKFDSSYDRDEPLEFVCGVGMMIPGFDAAVVDMQVGEIRDIHLMPEEAYGLIDPSQIFTVEIAQIPGAEQVSVGQQVYLQNSYGQPFPVTCTAKTETTITFDANHELAGKELNFHVEVVEIL